MGTKKVRETHLMHLPNFYDLQSKSCLLCDSLRLKEIRFANTDEVCLIMGLQMDRRHLLEQECRLLVPWQEFRRRRLLLGHLPQV